MDRVDCCCFCRSSKSSEDSINEDGKTMTETKIFGNDNYAYAFDNIGNRATEAVAIANSGFRMANYSTNNLNQYTEINRYAQNTTDVMRHAEKARATATSNFSTI